MKATSAFTLIELLIVVAIMAILSGFLMSLVATARRSANRTQCVAIMTKVDAAVRLFKNDFGTYPYLDYSATVLTGGQGWSNGLYHTIGTDITTANRLAVRADADAAAALYNYDCSKFAAMGGQPIEPSPPVSQHVFLTADVKPADWTYSPWSMPNWQPVSVGNPFATAVLLNRMGQERACLAIYAGNDGVNGCHILDAISPGTGAVYAAGRDNSTVALLASPHSAVAPNRPGMAVDYLGGELEARFISGDTVLDAYHNPLIYICSVVQGVHPVGGMIFGRQLGLFDPRQYGLASSIQPMPASIAAETTGNTGRVSLVQVDPATGVALKEDSTYLPDSGNLMKSDIRYYAAPGMETECELWSAGPDGRFDFMRDAAVNGDNVPYINYNRTLH
jgi:prepilin-type N-terminal cleavage/methylation domain-containing protein